MRIFARAFFSCSIGVLLAILPSGCFGGHVPTEMPAWAVPGTRIGDSLFDTLVFFEDDRMGPITGIQLGDWIRSSPGSEIAFTSTKGIAITTLKGELLDYADFRDSRFKYWFFVGDWTVMEDDSNGMWKACYGDGTSKVFLVDREGRVIWYEKMNVIAGAHGDLDGDGELEFVQANGRQMVLLDGDGRKLWHTDALKKLSLGPHSLYVVDLDADGLPEIVLNASHRLLVFNARGEFQSEIPLKANGRLDSDARLVRYPTQESEQYFLGSTEGSSCISLIGMDGTLVTPEFHAQLLFDQEGFPVRLRSDHEPYFVLCGWGGMQGHKWAGFEYSIQILQVFAPDGEEVYREHLKNLGYSMAVLPSEVKGEETFLVAGRDDDWQGRVVEYRIKKATTNHADQTE